MKIIINIGLVIFVASLFSCDPTETDPKPNTTNSSSAVTATVGNKQFFSETVIAYGYITDNDTVLEITATGTDQSLIKLKTNELKEKTYILSPSNKLEMEASYKAGGGGITFGTNADNGTISLSDVNLSKNTVTGTFSFSNSSVTITSGKLTTVPIQFEKIVL